MPLIIVATISQAIQPTIDGLIPKSRSVNTFQRECASIYEVLGGSSLL
jgi:hypothetical protein